MPGLQELEKRDQYFVSHIDDLFNEHQDPFFLRTVLRLIGREPYLSSIPEYLNVEAEKLEPVFNLFLQEDLIEIEGEKPSLLFSKSDTRNVGLSDAGEIYRNVDLSREFDRLPQWGKLTPTEAMQIMKTIEPFVHLSYYKDFAIPLKDLEPLKQTIETDVKNLQKKEQEYLRNVLNIPEGSYIHISFVQSQNPTWKDGAGYVDPCWVNGRMAYKTLDEAFTDMADQVLAWLKLDKKFKIQSETYDHFPVDFNLSLSHGKKGEDAYYSLRGGGHYGTGSDIWRKPLDYQRYGFEKAYELIDKIDALVPEKREKKEAPGPRH